MMNPDKITKFTSLVNTIRKSPVPKEILDMAKVFHHTDDMPAHDALAAAYRMMDTPIPNVHQVAIDELAKGHRWNPSNLDFYKKIIKTEAPAQPSGFIEGPRVSSQRLENSIVDSQPALQDKLTWFNRMMKDNRFTDAGEPMISQSYIDELAKSTAANGRNSEFIRLINALGLGW